MGYKEDRVASMNEVDEALAEALRTDPFPVHESLGLSLRAARAAHLSTLRHLYPIPGPIPSLVTETDHTIPVRDGTTIPIRIYTPTTPSPSSSPKPLILMFHEGGWCMGDLTDEALNCRLFARDLHAVCVNIAYRLAPEHPFPTCVHDAFDAVLWAARTASPSSPLLPADPATAGFIVGGASAGGHLSAVVCQLARDAHLAPPLTGQYLCVPALLNPGAVPEKWRDEYRSRVEAHSDPVLTPSTPESRSRFLSVLGNPDPASPLFSPLLNPDLTGLPPAFFQLAGLDPLRDEGLLYERVLREECGGKTSLKVYDGFGHMFWTNWPGLQRSKEFVSDTLEGVRWLLEVGEGEGRGVVGWRSERGATRQ